MELIDEIWRGSGLYQLSMGQAVMIGVGLLLLYLAIVRKFEPLLLVTIGFGGSSSAVKFFVHNPGMIDESVQSNIFKRYYSTKGGNRGLGTYSMKLLTEEYLGGEVSFWSTADRGTTFTFLIPNQGVAALRRG